MPGVPECPVQLMVISDAFPHLVAPGGPVQGDIQRKTRANVNADHARSARARSVKGLQRPVRALAATLARGNRLQFSLTLSC